MVKTLAEVEYYKQNWSSDPCWDLEDDPDFKEYHDELLSFRLEKEREWKETYSKRLWLKSCQMGIKGNLILTEYILNIENRLQELVDKAIQKEGY